MSLRYYEIGEVNHLIHNPLSSENLDLIAHLTRIKPGMRQLDLGCGHGEMLSRWARDHGISGVGVDLSAVFIDGARKRAAELGVSDRMEWVVSDAAVYEAEPQAFDIVSCIGATWIGGGTAGTMALMRKALKLGPDSRLLVGEVCWKEEPTDDELKGMGVPREIWPVGVDGLLEVFTAEGYDLVDFVMAEKAHWDRYTALRWQTTLDWLAANPDDPDAEGLRAWHYEEQRNYFRYERRCCDWGVYVLRVRV